MPTLVWMIDDSDANQRCAAATIARVPGLEYEGFLDGEEALAEFQRRAAAEPARLPRVILMDYYIGEVHGDELTERFRAVPTPLQPIIVGHSSIPSRSRRIVECGGNLAVPKLRSPMGINPELLDYLQHLHDLA